MRRPFVNRKEKKTRGGITFGKAASAECGTEALSYANGSGVHKFHR